MKYAKMKYVYYNAMLNDFHESTLTPKMLKLMLKHHPSIIYCGEL